MMDLTVPEPPHRPRRSGARLRRALVAAAGASLQGPSAAPQVPLKADLAAASALTDNWYESAPYYSVLDSDAPDLGTVMSATGAKAFDMAFILADNGSSCSPAWNGT